MRVLITGAAGFVGRHLAAELAAHGHEPVGLCLPGETPPPGVPSVTGDVVNERDLREALGALAPDACVHLAGVSSVPRSWADPAHTFEVNLAGTMRLLDAARAVRPTMRILVVSSAHIYGDHAGDATLDETAAPRPESPYAISKAAADQVALAYAAHFGLAALTARPANHIGPGQSLDFVIPSLAAQLAAIAAGRSGGPLRSGNLDSRRDFMDVRDTVRGYRLLIDHGRPGLAYHLAGGRLDRIADLLDRLCAIAGISPERVVDPARWRPADTSPRLDCGRILRDTGWTPVIPIEQTLRDVYDDVRTRIEGAES
jgi:GDP-4-dehydro-6-deoxy-D-mannose reductase